MGVYYLAILVTGGAGYVGSHVCVELLTSGYDLIIVDNFINSRPEVLKRIKNITGRTFLFYELDLLQEKSLENVFRENEIDAVIHLAGLKEVHESINRPLYYYKTNIQSTLILCVLMQKYGVKRIVFSSSAAVYGNLSIMPVSEDSPLCPLSPYGFSKAMIEQMLKDLSKAVPTWSIVILRYFNPIGAHESGLIGDEPLNTPNNLMSFLVQVAIGKKEKVSIFGANYETLDGTGIRDYLHVVDLARGHLAALQKVYNLNGVEIYNLGTGKGYSVLEVIDCFEKIVKRKIPFEFTGRRPGDVAQCFADPTKALEKLGWEPKKNLEDMCRDAWRWQKNNPYGYTV